MRTIETLRPALSGLAASASLASGFLLVAAEDAAAQEAVPAPQPGDQAIQLGPVKVEGTPSTNVLQTDTGLNRLPDALQSTPQTITVIPQLVIEQQQATTVDQVLQYVPGITVSTGEGNGGITGDQFRIRGFDASGDLYVDGLRDFGAYVRDSFATENVLVLKGSSSESFGNGTTGGAIELESKKAHLGDSISLEATGGSGPYGRGVFDVNEQIDDTTAVRVVGMIHGQDTVDRDHVYSDRWGFLGSVGFGLGTDQTVVVDYFHQHSNARPDFGVPTAAIGGPIAEPVTEYGVPRSNYFGRQSDHDDMDADVGTVLYTGQFGDWLTLTNDTRWGNYTRDLRFTQSLCIDLPPAYAAYYGLLPTSCATDVAAGNLNTDFLRWVLGGDKLTSYGGENVTTAVMRFDTFGLRHELIAGVDEYYQHQKMNFYAPVGSGPAGTLLNPNFDNPPGFSLVLSAAGGIDARSWDVGPFISDRIWLTDQLSVLGGVRWDHYNVEGNSEGTPVATTTEFASPKASLIWEPAADQTYYFSYAQSFTPPGNNITSLSSPLSILSAGPSTTGLKAEADSNLEVGGKWSLFDNRLGATAALYREDKGNTSYTDPTSGVQIPTDQKIRVQGLELGLTGKITDVWDVQASYSYMDSEILSSPSSPSQVGNQAPFVSKHGVALWTAYDIAPLLRDIPGQLLVGGGLNYRSEYYLNSTLTLRIPGATTADAFVSYDLDRYHFALKVTNVTDALAYNSAFGNGYGTPIAGRTFLVTGAIRF